MNLKVLVVKLYLKHDKNDPGSYNPIALQPVLLVLGKIIKAKLMSVLVKKHYFCIRNSWFQEKVKYIYRFFLTLRVMFIQFQTNKVSFVLAYLKM